MSDKNIFCFPYISQCKTLDPWGGVIFSPRGIIRTNLVEVYYVMNPNIKAIGLVVSDMNKKIMFHYISLCKTCDPWGGAILATRP